jgi:hypothetical protein
LQKEELLYLFKKRENRLPLKVKRIALTTIYKFLNTKSGEETINVNHLWAQLLNIKDLKASDLNLLSLATVEGWVAYSIIDNIIDQKKNIDLLTIANTLSRLSFETFKDCEVLFSIYNHKTIINLCPQIFNMIDEVNYINCSNKYITSDRLISAKYCLRQTYQKSIGHALGPLLIAQYFCGVNHREHSFEFFKNYIIARQLHDDGLDWKEDIADNNLTIPLRLLLIATQKTSLKQLQLSKITKSQMEKLYKNKCLPQIYKLINLHLRRSKKHLNSFGKSEEISNLLNKLQIHI